MFGEGRSDSEAGLARFELPKAAESFRLPRRPSPCQVSLPRLRYYQRESLPAMMPFRARSTPGG